MFSFACENFNLDEVIRCSLNINKTEQNILNILTKKDESIKSLSKRTGLERSAVQKNVKRMLEQGLIIRSQKNLAGGGYTYFYSAKDKELLRKKIMKTIEGWTQKARKEVKTW